MKVDPDPAPASGGSGTGKTLAGSIGCPARNISLPSLQGSYLAGVVFPSRVGGSAFGIEGWSPRLVIGGGEVQAYDLMIR